MIINSLHSFTAVDTPSSHQVLRHQMHLLLDVVFEMVDDDGIDSGEKCVEGDITEMHAWF